MLAFRTEGILGFGLIQLLEALYARSATHSRTSKGCKDSGSPGSKQVWELMGGVDESYGHHEAVAARAISDT